MRERDEREVMREALSDEVDASSLLLTDDGLSFRRPGVPPDVTVRLRRGIAVPAEGQGAGLALDRPFFALNPNMPVLHGLFQLFRVGQQGADALAEFGFF